MRCRSRLSRLSVCCRISFCVLLGCASSAFAAQSTPQTKAAPTSTATAAQPTTKPDLSKEAYVVERLETHVFFEADGTGTRDVRAVVRLQSDAAVRELGILRFPYVADSENLEVISVQVKKADGSVVATPASHIQDLPGDVARVAPTYSDLREKQIPVRALSPGDTLEYRVRWTRTKSEYGGHLWYTDDFVESGAVLEETLEVSVPEQQYIRYSSPDHKPSDQKQNGRRILFWRTSHLPSASDAEPAAPNSSESAEQPTPKKPAHSVQLSSFRSWEEVGIWYRNLAIPETAVTPAIQAKALELTKGLTTNLEKEKALYQFVSTKFRYISISFGTGRYQPHSADDVLAEEYGDCKDKHTLFAALLKAVGIEAWPVLIGAGIVLDPEVPSPGQFNHLITVIPSAGTLEWLDTTSGVVPFGTLEKAVRDEQALVIPLDAPPSLRKTPEALPFPSVQRFEVKGSLSPEGTLTAHFETTWRGDEEMLLRGVFGATPAAQWNDLVQNVSLSIGFGGKVTNTKVQSLDDLTKPFQFSYDYTRETYSDWANLRISPPLPPLGLPSPEGKAPAEPLDIGTVGEVSFHSEIRMPDGFTFDIPAEARMRTAFADYRGANSFAAGVLSTERTLHITSEKVPVSAWPDYQKLAHAVAGDHDQLIQLTRTSGKAEAVVVVSDPQAEALVRQAAVALSRKDLPAAKTALDEAERLNPKQRSLWFFRAGLDQLSGDPKAAIADYKKEVQAYPEDPTAWILLGTMQAQLGLADDGLATYKEGFEKLPGNPAIAYAYSNVLLYRKRYADAAEVARLGLATDKNDQSLKTNLLKALLQGGQKEEGLKLARQMIGETDDALALNNVAYQLGDSGTELALAQQYADKSVARFEDQLKGLDVNALTADDLSRTSWLAAAWDTLGWISFARETWRGPSHIYPRLGPSSKAARWPIISATCTSSKGSGMPQSITGRSLSPRTRGFPEYRRSWTARKRRRQASPRPRSPIPDLRRKPIPPVPRSIPPRNWASSAPLICPQSIARKARRSSSSCSRVPLRCSRASLPARKLCAPSPNSSPPRACNSSCPTKDRSALCAVALCPARSTQHPSASSC